MDPRLRGDDNTNVTGNKIMSPSPVHQKAWPLYRRLLGFVKPFWPVLLVGISANALYALLDAGFTYMMRPFLDKGFIDMDTAFVKLIPWIVLIGISARGLVNALGTYCMTSVARSVVKVLRQDVFAHIVKLPSNAYDKAPSGQLLSKILYDVEQVAQVSSDVLTDFVQNSCLVIGLLTVMLVICWQLSLIFLITIPFIGLIVNYTNKRVRRISHKIQQSMGAVTEIASETIDGYREVRIYGGQAYEVNKFNQATEGARLNDLKVAFTRALNVCSVQAIIAIGICTIVLAAIHLATIITITAGSFLAIIAAMLQLIKPMKTLTMLNANIQRGLAGAESVFALLDSETEPTSGQQLQSKARGHIKFDQVSFSYPSSRKILNNVSFEIKPYQTVALVGHSGSGKTTIACLIPRFYEISSGTITLDDNVLSNLSLNDLRSQIALVSQHVILFNDTVANNIAYGSFGVSLAQVKQAAKLAFASEFIEHLPEGYQTKVGENGVLLSGGQRQRIAIARAILKNAPILILDEATSALDSESERMIQLALENIRKDRTTIVIAHRLSTIMGADMILVLNKGCLVEQGTHTSLLARNGYYAKLVQTQQVGIKDDLTIETIGVPG